MADNEPSGLDLLKRLVVLKGRWDDLREAVEALSADELQRTMKVLSPQDPMHRLLMLEQKKRSGGVEDWRIVPGEQGGTWNLEYVPVDLASR